MYRYWSYNLPIESDISLPNLPARSSLQPEEDCITIQIGAVPERLVDSTVKGILYQVGASIYLLQIPGLARYLVSNGNRIVVQPANDADENSVRLFLQGPVMGALLHQRRMFPIHGSSVVTSGGVLVFAGISGTGKSTLAAAFHQLGYSVLADEISVIHIGEDYLPRVVPGPYEIKLWRSALTALNYRNSDALDRVRPEIDKFIVPLNIDAQVAPLRMITILNPVNRDEHEVVPVDFMLKLPNLTNLIYQRRLALEMGAMPDHWETASAITPHTHMAYLNRPMRGFDLEALVSIVEEALSA